MTRPVPLDLFASLIASTRVAVSFDAGQEWQSSCFEALRDHELADGLVKIRGLQ